MPNTDARPSPEPFPGPFVVKNGSKTLARVVSSKPTPVSLTVSVADRPFPLRDDELK